MDISSSLTARAQQVAALVMRIQALAAGVARRSKVLGIVALVAAPIAWVTLFGRWAFDSVPQFVFFGGVLVIMLLPGAALLTFAQAVRMTATQSDEVLAEVRGLVRQSGSELATGVSAVVARPGLRQLGTLLGSFWQLRKFRGDFASIAAKFALSTRLLNPLYLLWVAGAALAAGLVVGLAALGVALLVI